MEEVCFAAKFSYGDPVFYQPQPGVYNYGWATGTVVWITGRSFHDRIGSRGRTQYFISEDEIGTSGGIWVNEDDLAPRGEDD